MSPDDIARYKRAMAYRMSAVWGLEPATPRVLSYDYPSAKDRYDAWLHDSLYTAFDDLEKGDVLLAFRGLLLARQYVGMCGGFNPGGHSGDAAGALRNEIERVINGEVSK